MKTCSWSVITVLTLAINLLVLPVSAAPSVSITVTRPLPNPASIGSEASFALVITISDISQGTVLRQGTPANLNLSGGTLACSEVNGVFTEPSGKFEFSLINPLSGTYLIRAGYPGYLSSETTVAMPPSRDVGTTTLCGGDVNADRVINILDIGTIVGNFGRANMPVRSDLSVPPLFPNDCTDPDEPIDINDDSLVNISDLAIAAGNFGLTGPTPWDTTQCDP